MKDSQQMLKRITKELAGIESEITQLRERICALDTRRKHLKIAQSVLRELQPIVGDECDVYTGARLVQSAGQTAMPQHFLLSSAARSISLEAVMQMSETEAREAFASIRWYERNGNPCCPRCSCPDLYTCKAENRWKCKECGYRFSVTSGTIFASRKLAIRDILAAIAIFVNGAKGYSASQLSRDLDVQYRTAWLLVHKLREALC
jgi:transposase-like protein